MYYSVGNAFNLILDIVIDKAMNIINPLNNSHGKYTFKHI